MTKINEMGKTNKEFAEKNIKREGVNMSKKTIVALTLLNSDKIHYGLKIESFKKLENFPEGDKITSGNEFAITVSDEAWANMDTEFDYESDECMKFVVTADNMVDINENTVCLEFNEDSYGKFIFLFKKENGAYL